jgi:phospholipase C
MIGPNQFYRRFKGYLSTTAWQGQPEPQVKLTNNGVGQAVSILFDNSGTTNTAVFTLLDRITSGSVTTQTITVAPRQTATVQFATTGGWYDVKISLSGDSNFMQSMVGYTEGQQGLTRPPVLRW